MVLVLVARIPDVVEGVDAGAQAAVQGEDLAAGGGVRDVVMARS